ncbi:hypothetical protein G9444_0784 [Rhodococcus erythropolis]|uniref:Uncharacterized protein n=1 Tax=Rhodococcus erythropolis TaxID=1833 RepID=A0A6G9CMB9_RHOER|nr:hypothetical protein [Rhodococcus erythropolis]QIP38028.1 hypothetical protein G9444_0784 [Rhodococcus erythropolis]
MTTRFPELTPEQLTQALRTAQPVDQDAMQRAQAEAQRALNAAFSRIRTVTP